MIESENRYEIACAEHRWEVPARYNIAADVCDAPSARRAGDGPRGLPTAPSREVHWGELQDARQPAANVLAGLGVERGDRVAVVLPPTPETAARLLRAPGSSGRSCSRCRCSTATRASATGSTTPSRRCWSPTRRTPPRFERSRVEHVLILDEPSSRRQSRRRSRRADTAADDPAQLYYTSGTTGLAKGIVHAHRYLLAHEEFELLPRRAGRRALPRHGRVGLGGGDLPAARALAPRRRPVRLPARGRLRPPQAARLPLAPRGHATCSPPRRRSAR